jgi:hypothetical protein
VLRRISQTRNIRLHEIAREIVTRTSGNPAPSAEEAQGAEEAQRAVD